MQVEIAHGAARKSPELQMEQVTAVRNADRFLGYGCESAPSHGIPDIDSSFGVNVLRHWHSVDHRPARAGQFFSATCRFLLPAFAQMSRSIRDRGDASHRVIARRAQAG